MIATFAFAGKSYDCDAQSLAPNSQRGVGTELTGSSHGKMRLTQREKPWTVRARHLANQGRHD